MAVNSPSTHITQIKDGSVVMGNIRSEDSIRVDGHITGDLISKEKIIIGSNGHIGGALSGTDITIDGFVNGDIVSSGFLQISAAAKIYGKIFAKEISIEKGAEMNGKVNVGLEVEIPEVNSSSPTRSIKSNLKSQKSKDKDTDQHDKFGNVAW
jgi:cytoskeletal protein CcmA (bactofilin family)